MQPLIEAKHRAGFLKVFKGSYTNKRNRIDREIEGRFLPLRGGDLYGRAAYVPTSQESTVGEGSRSAILCLLSDGKAGLRSKATKAEPDPPKCGK
jgi:hypothetical protein